MELPERILSDEQLNFVLDEVAGGGEASAAQHPDTAARLRAWQQFDQRLETLLARWDCLPAQELGDYHWGFADRTAAQTIARHLETCVRCKQELETLRIFLSDDAQPTPHPSTAAPQRRTARLRDLVATVIPRVPGLAVRGAGSAPIIAQARDITVVLDVEPASAGQVTLVGQLAVPNPDQWSGALVEVRQNTTLRATAEVDDMSSFRCGPLPIATSEIHIIPPSGTGLILPGIVLGGDEEAEE